MRREREELSEVSVILPVFNAAGSVPRVFDAVCRFARRQPEYHFLFVDDGSRDQTATLLKRCIAETGNGHVSLLSYPVNRGKGYAIKTAFPHTNGNRVLFTDGDLAYSLDHLPMVVENLDNHDVVAGSRSLVPHQGRDLPLIRRLFGLGFNCFVRFLLDIPYRDTQAGLKGFRREAAERLFRLVSVHDFSFDAELLYLARSLGYRIAEVPARVSSEHDFKNSTVRLLRDPARMFFSLLRIRLNCLAGRYKLLREPQL